jgi:hypothetical protein
VSYGPGVPVVEDAPPNCRDGSRVSIALVDIKVALLVGNEAEDDLHLYPRPLYFGMGSGRSHKETCACCVVSLTIPTRSSPHLSKQTL